MWKESDPVKFKSIYFCRKTIHYFFTKLLCIYMYSKVVKELSVCPKNSFSNPNIITTRFCNTPLIFQTINSGRSSCISLKYQRFTHSRCKDLRIRIVMESLSQTQNFKFYIFEIY